MSLSSIILPRHALFLLLLTLVLAATATSTSTSIPVPAEHDAAGDVMNTTTTTTFINGSSPAAAAADDKEEDEGNWDMYFCFLCSGRDPLLIHHCPIYWDQCHLICDDDMQMQSTSTSSTGMISTAAPHEDCYVMKLYKSGRYVIVEHRPCKYIAWCFLTCGGGELADHRKAIMGGTAAAATIQGSFLPAAVDEELCGTQVRNNAPWTAPPSAPAAGGVVVPAAGGAHRRRR